MTAVMACVTLSVNVHGLLSKGVVMLSKSAEVGSTIGTERGGVCELAWQGLLESEIPQNAWAQDPYEICEPKVR
jgi:hypothetical protein